MKKMENIPADDQTPYKLIIRGKEYDVLNCYLEQSSLRFYPENPRVYSALHRDDGQRPSQEDIEEHLKEMDHVRELRDDIRENDGLIEPLYVKKATLEVVEGNSRLAAYRLLTVENAIKWALVKCVLLPEEVNDSAIASLLGQLHLKGKKDWSPYEQASFLYRRHHNEKVSIKALETEFNLKEKSIKHRIAVIDFMIKHKDNNTARWSHYDEFLKNRKFRQACEEHADFEDTVVEQIKTGDLKAVEVRDKLKVICNTKSEKPIKNFISGCSLDDAVKSAKSLGGDHNGLQRLRRFRLWIVESERKHEIREAAHNIKAEMGHELRTIKARVEKLCKLFS